MLEFTIRRRIGQRPSPRAERDVRPRETSHETCFVLGDHFRSLLKAKGLFGGRTRARTWDPLIKSQLLYQLSYAPECSGNHDVERLSSGSGGAAQPSNSLRG